MNQQHFNFLEVSDASDSIVHPIGTPHHHQTIPDNQYLSYFDLVALKPDRVAAQKIAKNLITKYRFIPLAILPSQLNLRLPQHFDLSWHPSWHSSSALTLYIALCKPTNSHVLRMLHNATGYTIHAVPLREQAYEQFEQSHLADLLKK